jgi:hypothetical protein
MRQQEDWYAYLNVPVDAPGELIEPAVEKLSRQAAALAATAPERSQRLRDTVRAIKRDLLSGPEARARYDQAREAAAAPSASESPAYSPPADPPVSGFPPPSAYAPPSTPAATPAASAATPAAPAPVPPPPPYPPFASPTPGAAPPAGGPGGAERMSARLVRFLRTGWVCEKCGKEAMPSDKFCTRCGTPIIPTRHEQAPPTPRVTCVNCAAPLGANDAFCSRCGTRSSK